MSTEDSSLTSPGQRSLRRFAVVIPALIVIAALVTWGLTRDRLPDRIRIAAGKTGGQFDEVARALAVRLTRRTHRRVEIVMTEGSADNARLLRSGDVELALVQATRDTMQDVACLAPLYADVYVAVARKGRGITRIVDLASRPVAIGRPGSGVYTASIPLLARYGVTDAALVARPQAFAELSTDPTLDAAIVVTGLLSPELAHVLGTGDFDVIGIDDADALALREPFLVAHTIPAGMFSANPRIPEVAVPTVATAAVLITSPDASDKLVGASLASLYEDTLELVLPTLIHKEEARHFHLGQMHGAALAYYDPYAGMDVLSNIIQSLDAGKELLVALGAAIYLVIERLRRASTKIREQADLDAADALDVYLDHTVALERSQMSVSDPNELLQILDQVTAVKLEALERLTNERLRSDQRFLIFLTQCASLTQKLHTKIELAPKINRS